LNKGEIALRSGMQNNKFGPAGFYIDTFRPRCWFKVNICSRRWRS